MSVSFIDGHIDEPKMTNNEIIKALECCKKDDCDNCPNDFGNCYANLAGYALDLINRQKSEIKKLDGQVTHLIGYVKTLKAEKDDLKIELQAMRNAANGYKAEIERLRGENKALRLALDLYKGWEEKAKAEAVKEFAERLKKRMGFCDLPMEIVKHHIDNLLKETVGDADDFSNRAL